MKTIAISTLGWPEWECEAFEQYVTDLALDYDANITVCQTVDHHFEIDIDEDDLNVVYHILSAIPDLEA